MFGSFLPFANKKRADAPAAHRGVQQVSSALATRGRGSKEPPPSGRPCTSLALAARGRGSWNDRRAGVPVLLRPLRPEAVVPGTTAERPSLRVMKLWM